MKFTVGVLTLLTLASSSLSISLSYSAYNLHKEIDDYKELDAPCREKLKELSSYCFTENHDDNCKRLEDEKCKEFFEVLPSKLDECKKFEDLHYFDNEVLATKLVSEYSCTKNEKGEYCAIGLYQQKDFENSQLYSITRNQFSKILNDTCTSQQCIDSTSKFFVEYHKIGNSLEFSPLDKKDKDEYDSVSSFAERIIFSQDCTDRLGKPLSINSEVSNDANTMTIRLATILLVTLSLYLNFF